MTASTSKVKRVKNLTTTDIYDNSGIDAKFDVSATVVSVNGKVTEFRDGKIELRGQAVDPMKSFGIFACTSVHDLDLHIYKSTASATRTELMNDLEIFMTAAIAETEAENTTEN